MTTKINSNYLDTQFPINCSQGYKERGEPDENNGNQMKDTWWFWQFDWNSNRFVENSNEPPRLLYDTSGNW